MKITKPPVFRPTTGETPKAPESKPGEPKPAGSAERSSFAAAVPKAPSRPVPQAKQLAAQTPPATVPGLPLSNPLASAARAHGAVIAFQLARHWARLPGEKRVPQKARRAVLEGLPKGPWPEGELLSEDQVLEYCNDQRGQQGGRAKQLMAGQSGAQVFLVESDQGEGSIFKMFCSAEEMLLDVAALEVINNLQGHPLRSVAVERAGTAHEGEKAFVVMEKAPGTVLYERMDEVAAATEPHRAAVLATLREELACAGVALAKFHEAGRSGKPVPDGYKRLAVARVMGLFTSAMLEAGSGPLSNPELRGKMSQKLWDITKAFQAAPLEGTVCIGDVHPGNIAVHQGQCTVFDVNTLVASLGERGEGIAPSADDRMWFAETIPWYGRKIGLAAQEIAAAYDAFLNAYRNNSPLAAAPADPPAVRFFRLRSALTDLRFAPQSKPELDRVLSQMELSP